MARIKNLLARLGSLVFAMSFLYSKARALECYCNSTTCIANKTSVCQAKFACYTEMLTNSAIYGCSQNSGVTAMCVRQGKPSKDKNNKKYLLMCCFTELCNMPGALRANVKKSRRPTTAKIEKPKRSSHESREYSPLQFISVKVLSIIAAGGLFTLMLIVACAVHLLCYEERSKVKSVLKKNSSMNNGPRLLINNSPV